MLHDQQHTHYYERKKERELGSNTQMPRGYLFVSTVHGGALLPGGILSTRGVSLSLVACSTRPPDIQHSFFFITIKVCVL